MKKNLHTYPARLSATPFMALSWREFCGEARMPRSPEKILRKIIRASRRDLRELSIIFKNIVFSRFEDRCFALSLILHQAELIEANLSRLYDSCAHCRLRYRNQLEQSIQRSSHYYFQASALHVYEYNRKIVQVITEEKVLKDESVECTPQELLSIIEVGLS